jgi:hypothetical protein
MAEEGLDFNEEDEVRKGGKEAESADPGFDEAVESQKKRIPPGEPNLQTPTELAGGAAGEGQGLHTSGPAES